MIAIQLLTYTQRARRDFHLSINSHHLKIATSSYV